MLESEFGGDPSLKSTNLNPGKLMVQLKKRKLVKFHS